ncbi:hypothetical protein IPM19_01790 [bacterium]|nr:MAG: hypothetical protein IPM19_01790 [bacterium]
MAKDRSSNLANIYLRLPLLNTFLKPIVDGRYVYVPGIDPEKFERVTGFFEKAQVKDESTLWRSFKGYDGLKAVKAFSEEEVDTMLDEYLQQVHTSYPELRDDPILSELTKTIYDLKPVIVAAENRDVNGVNRSLQALTYALLSAFSEVITLIREVKKQGNITDSLLSSYEHLDDQDAKLWAICGEKVHEYHQQIKALFEFEHEMSTQYLTLSKEIKGMVSRRVKIYSLEEELQPVMSKHILNEFSDADTENLRIQVEEFYSLLTNYNEDCGVYGHLVSELKSRLALYPAMVKAAKKAFESFSTFRKEEDISALVLQKWVPEEVYNQAMLWMDQRMHSATTWDAKFLKLQGELSNCEHMLTAQETAKVSGWLKAIPEAVQVKSAVPLPSFLGGGKPLGSFAGLPTAPTVETSLQSIEAVESFSAASPDPPVVNKVSGNGSAKRAPIIIKADGTKKKAEKRGNEKHASKLPDLYINPELPIPETLDDLMELFELVAAAREPNRNPLRGATFKSSWEILQMAGFDLREHDIEQFRKHFLTCECVRIVGEDEDPRVCYDETGKHMLVYSIGTGGARGKERYKLAERRYTHNSSLTALEEKWDITRKSLQFLAKQRKDATDF